MRIVEDSFDQSLDKELQQKFGKSDAKEMKQDILQADRQLGGDAEVAFSDDSGDIEQALNDALEANLEQIEFGGTEFVNVLLIGEAGTGKTSRVFAWAKKHKINIYNVDAKTLDITDLGGAIHANKDATAVNRLATTELDALERPRSVLFLDEYNRAENNIRGTLLTLINDHQLRDAREESGYRFFKNFLFTIAAINPPSSFDDVNELDQAELSRFYQVEVAFDPVNTLNYLNDKFEKDLKKAGSNNKLAAKVLGRQQLANTLLKNPQFEFDNSEEARELQRSQKPILNPRSLTKLLAVCDGTKDDFLRKWPKQCNPDKLSMVDRILANYRDIDNKANSVFNSDDDDLPDFMKGPSHWDKISGKINDEF